MTDGAQSAFGTPRWIDALVEYFRELGGEAHYSELYAYISANPRRTLGKEWQAVVRRTIEEHSSDTSIWAKRKLPDLFRSVDGIGQGRWALRTPATISAAPMWTLQPGDTIKRGEIQRTFGGPNIGGICPSTTSPNIFLYTDPVGKDYGYVFDGWHADGCFYYTGTGKTGDQQLKGFNKSLLTHAEDGKTLRLFQGNKGIVTYKGPFTLDNNPAYYRDDAPETSGGPLRSVLVFRLRPSGLQSAEPSVARAITTEPTVTLGPVEGSHVEKYSTAIPISSGEAERREAKLVDNFCKFLKRRKFTPKGGKIRPPGLLSRLAIDVYVPQLNLLIEAKGTVERNAFRLAIGQLADYRRYLESPTCAILLPSQPSADLLDLAKIERLVVVWADDKSFSATADIFGEPFNSVGDIFEY